MYWTDWGWPRIQSAYMDGTNRKTIVRSNIRMPNGLTIDYTSDKLFWTDSYYHTVETANTDGSGRKASSVLCS